MFKVIIHELFHYYNIDNNRCSNVLNEYFDIIGYDNCNEAYVETLALLINSHIIASITQTSIREILVDEILHSFFQVSKILDVMGYETYPDKITIRQHTSVCSYYIGKLCLLLNYNELISEVQKSWIISDFVYENSFDRLGQYNETINRMLRFINEKRDGTSLFSNLKMCLYDLGIFIVRSRS